jgi:integrase
MPTVPAFSMVKASMRVRVLQKDMADARAKWLETAGNPQEKAEMEKTDFLVYKDRTGRFADFHALRSVTASYLLQNRIAPKVAQSILRHSDVKLTMGIYGHSFREDEAAAMAQFPDLSRRPKANRQAKAG